MIRRLFIFAGCAALSAMAADAKFDAAVATNQLGLDLYRQLAKDHPKGNLVISPYSIDSAIALAYSGADGATRTEMAGGLHFPEDDASLQASFRNLRFALDQPVRGSVELHQANRLFGQQGYAIRPAFLTLMKVGYDAPIELLDFKTNANAAREGINSWVEDQTHRKIRSLIPRGGLDGSSRLVLVNALYLKAPWEKPFREDVTQSRPFHLNSAEAPEVSTMHRTDHLRYVKEPGFTVVSLPYVGDQLQFLVLLPDEASITDAVVAKLTPERFKVWAELAPIENPWTRIELYLPRFRVEGSSLALGSALRLLGMKRAFDEPQGSADFGRIAVRQSDDYLKLSEVFHRTFIAVDEKGTEAAAATAVVVTGGFSMSALPPPVVVRIDRPFLFAIQDRVTGVCLFLGRITDPR